MFVFGHVGITTAAAIMGDILLSTKSPGEDEKPGFRTKLSAFMNRLRSSTGNIDYRLVVIGSMLPDIIDKPLFLLLADRGVSLSGRDYGHTLLFHLVLLAGSLLLLRYKKPWLLVITLSSFVHLIFDRMWEVPVTLFWPFLGSLPVGETTYWASNMWNDLVSVPKVYIPEIIGLVALLFLAYRIVKNRGVVRFIRNGIIA